MKAVGNVRRLLVVLLWRITSTLVASSLEKFKLILEGSKTSHVLLPPPLISCAIGVCCRRMPSSTEETYSTLLGSSPE